MWAEAGWKLFTEYIYLISKNKNKKSTQKGKKKYFLNLLSFCYNCLLTRVIIWAGTLVLKRFGNYGHFYGTAEICEECTQYYIQSQAIRGPLHLSYKLKVNNSY